MATSISVPGAGSAPPLVFTVTGTSTINQAVAFQNALQTASQNGDLQINLMSGTGVRGHGPASATVVLNEIFSNSATSTYTLSTGGQYTLIDVGTPVSVNGSGAGGDTVLGAGDVTFHASGGFNTVTFLDGTNTYIGGNVSGDVVTAGAGFDTIDTGTGSTTVFSGAGSDHINLNNLIGGDIVVLNDGTAHSVVASGDGPVTIFDSVGSNLITGGPGALFFVAGATPVSDTIVSGAGQVAAFGSNGTNITLEGTTNLQPAFFVAGAGNETLNGATSGSFAFFGSTDTASTASVVGGSGTDYFIAGGGTEQFTAGTGTDLFEISTVPGASITITDFAAKDYVEIAGQDSATTASQLAGGTLDTNGNYTVKLGDSGTTVTFVGLTSFNGHTI